MDGEHDTTTTKGGGARAGAGVLARVWAALVDGALNLLPSWMSAPVVAALWFAGASETRLAAMVVLELNALLSLIFFLVRPSFHMLRGRPTFGRKKLSLELVARDGSPPSLLRRGARQLLVVGFSVGCLVTGWLPLLAVPFAWALVDRRSRNLYDVLVGTVWVKAHTSAPPDTQRAMSQA